MGKLSIIFFLFFFLSSCKGGNGGGPSVIVPVPVPNTEMKVIQISNGAAHSCALFENGKIKCWGGNGSGQLGYGSILSRGSSLDLMGENLPFVDLGTNYFAIQVEVGGVHSCAILNTGKVKCWGYNGYGELGLGDIFNRGDQANEMGNNLLVVNLGTSYKATQLSSGLSNTCALLDTGKIKCWGLFDSTRVGDQTSEMGDNLLVVDVAPGYVANQISTGLGGNYCAVLSTNKIKCWGRNNYGQLGLENTESRDTANEMGSALPIVDLGNNYSAIKVSSGSNHTCALLSTGKIKCWGYNVVGQLGSGNTSNLGDGVGEMGNSLPDVNLGSSYIATDISAGDGHTCAILNTGKVKCWGFNGVGQLGLGDTANRGDGNLGMGSLLANVDLGENYFVTSLSSLNGSEPFSCVILDGGKVKCWGWNSSGQLGIGDTQRRGDNPYGMGVELPYLELW